MVIEVRFVYLKQFKLLVDFGALVGEGVYKFCVFTKIFELSRLGLELVEAHRGEVEFFDILESI